MTKHKVLTKNKKVIRSKSKLGKAPGHIGYVGNKERMPSKISLFKYDEDTVHDTPIESDLMVFDTGHCHLLNVVGISDEDAINTIGQSFGLDNLLLEDVMDAFQRPKIDEYKDHIFGVFKMLYINGEHQIIIEHIAVNLVPNGVILFQEIEEDVFDGVKERIKNKHGRIRSRGADYLFYALLDAIVDNYYVVLEDYRDRLELLEEEAYEHPTEETAKKIQVLKKEILRIRKWVFPVKEIIVRLLQSEHPLLTKDTKLFFRDTLDHCTEINEDIQLYREMATSVMEIYMTQMSNKMNEVMKVLTVIASIFIPLTFLAGIYGMNFEHMPELQFKYGYFALWGIFLLVGVGLLIFFKRKGWL
jgi:magnesium transporter